MGSTQLHGSARPHLSGFVARLAALISATAALAGPVTWEPIPLEHRQARPPASNPDAVAEILYERMDLVVRNYHATQRNLQRVKIYSERAVEEIGKLGVEYSEGERVSELAARVVQADGKIVDLPESQFQETTLSRADRRRSTARRLIVPRLQVGDIVELQWRVDEDGRLKGSRFIYCQQTIPVRKFEFLLRNDQSGAMNLASFGVTDPKLEMKNNSRGRLLLTDLPAYVEEPDMPPAFNVRSSLLLVYGKMPAFGGSVWPIAADVLKLLDSVQCAPTKEIQKSVKEIIAGQDFREDQLRQLYAYCQEKITNVAFDEAPESLAERINYHEPRTAGAVWKDRRGSSVEINCLFAALAKAAGFEACLTFSADRSEVMNVQFSHGWYFMKTSGVLVKVAGEWRLFAPGDRAVPFGQSRWQREETETLYVENDFIQWLQVTTTFQQQARQNRQGQLAIDDAGNLEGDITEKLEGQRAIAWREAHWNLPAVQLEGIVRDRVQEQLPEAEVTRVTAENLSDTAQPVVLRYHLRVPNYLSSAGERRLIIPAFFHLHAQPRYSAPTRVNPVWWQYPAQEVDDFELQLPAGYEVEAARSPAPVYDPAGIIRHQVNMQIDPVQNRLRYHREEVIGRANSLVFGPQTYPALKRLFEQIHGAQTHALVLRPKSAATASIP